MFQYTYYVLTVLLILLECTHITLADANETLSSEDDLLQRWQKYKDTHQKSYSKTQREERSRLAWKENYKKIKQHNEETDKGIHTYRLRDNYLADLSLNQYMRLMVKLTKSNRRKLADDDEIISSDHLHHHNLPDELDWRDKGFITPPVNQLLCGSCYAFTIAHVIEGQLFKHYGELMELSAQQIVDCSTRLGNYGCGGGSLRNSLRYIEQSGGLMAYSDYPYNAKQNKCHYDRRKAVGNLTTWAILPARNELALQKAVANIGPIAVAINASPDTFQLYSEGIYDDARCSSKHVNHAMLLIGYTKDYWILKNWWGKTWGEDGYMKLRRNKNQCGVANYAAYSII